MGEGREGEFRALCWALSTRNGGNFARLEDVFRRWNNERKRSDGDDFSTINRKRFKLKLSNG